MRVARIAGADILVDPPVIVLFAAAACLGYLTRGLLLAAAIIVHDTAHGAAAFFLGYRLEEIRVFPLGGSVRIGGMSGYDPAAEALIALAGPVASILMSMFTMTFKDHGLLTLPDGNFVAINTIIFLFNLLPALPLDGGRLLEHIVLQAGYSGCHKGGVPFGKYYCRFAGTTCALPGAGKPWAVHGSGCRFCFAGPRKEMAASLAITQRAQRKACFKKGAFEVQNFVAAYNASGRVISHFVPGYYHIVFVVGKNGEVLGKVTEQEIISGMIRYGYNVRMEQIIRMHN